MKKTLYKALKKKGWYSCPPTLRKSIVGHNVPLNFKCFRITNKRIIYEERTI